MQDLLVYVTKGLSALTTQLRAEGQAVDKAVNHLISVNLFITITNATLPAFLSPNIANVLVENFGIAGITTVEDDMKIFGI